MKVIGVPFGKGGLGKGDGSVLGPAAIAKHLDGGFNYESLELDKNIISEAHKQIESSVEQVQEKTILLGGDHSISYSAVKAFAKKHADFLFIVFDAHPDLMEDFIPPTHEAYLRALIDEDILKAENVIILGVRNSDKQEDEYLVENNLLCFRAETILQRGVTNIMNEVISHIDKPVYLSLDIDVVDPRDAPGTGYPEAHGISGKDFLYCLEELKDTGKLAMIDLVEVQPKKDIHEKTVKLAAKSLELLKDY